MKRIFLILIVTVVSLSSFSKDIVVCRSNSTSNWAVELSSNYVAYSTGLDYGLADEFYSKPKSVTEHKQSADGNISILYSGDDIIATVVKAKCDTDESEFPLTLILNTSKGPMFGCCL